MSEGAGLVLRTRLSLRNARLSATLTFRAPENPKPTFISGACETASVTDWGGLLLGSFTQREFATFAAYRHPPRRSFRDAPTAPNMRRMSARDGADTPLDANSAFEIRPPS